jgi:hypothetical protein
MQNKSASASLKEAISLLEIRQAAEGKLLKDQLFVVYEKLKPINLIKGTFEEIASSFEIKSSIVNRLLGALSVYLTHKLFVGSKPNIFKKLAGIVLEYGAATVISKYAEPIETIGLQLITKLLSNKTKEDIKPASENSD